jgi:S-adenosyl-L-methionine hydrolase (adenosine-forming)
MTSHVIALLTDFGLRDPFVGIMKGVMLGINPALQIVDVSHEIRPQHVREAALVLSVTQPYFPSKTIFVVVIDPGVGGSRRALVAETADHLFVAPDNGVLGPVLEQGEVRRVVHASHPAYFRRAISRTFHGRDIFAPLAAWLSQGVDPGVLGSTINDYVRLPLAHPQALGDGTLAGEIIYQDHFGNLITNLSETWLAKQWGTVPSDGVALQIEQSVIRGIDAYYAQRSPHALGMIVNSWGLLEVFAYGGQAAMITGAAEGSPIKIWCEPATRHISSRDSSQCQERLK